MFKWIRKPMLIEKREILDFMFWMVLILLVGFSVFLYLAFPFLTLIPFLLIIIDLKLLITNYKIALKEIKAKKENTIKDNITFI